MNFLPNFKHAFTNLPNKRQPTVTTEFSSIKDLSENIVDNIGQIE